MTDSVNSCFTFVSDSRLPVRKEKFDEFSSVNSANQREAAMRKYLQCNHARRRWLDAVTVNRFREQQVAAGELKSMSARVDKWNHESSRAAGNSILTRKTHDGCERTQLGFVRGWNIVFEHRANSRSWNTWDFFTRMRMWNTKLKHKSNPLKIQLCYIEANMNNDARRRRRRRGRERVSESHGVEQINMRCIFLLLFIAMIAYAPEKISSQWIRFCGKLCWVVESCSIWNIFYELNMCCAAE